MSKVLKIESFKKVSPFLKSDLVGGRGSQGGQGLPGIEGAQGPVGVQGPLGPKGDRGEVGPIGDRGATGSTGSQGVPGVHGIQGELGPMPIHQTRGDAIRFEISPGTFGKWINLNPGTPHAPIGGGGISEDRAITLIETLSMAIEYNVLVDTVLDFKYIGSALPGVAESLTGWRIKRLDLSDTGGDIDIFWADGTSDFDKIWDDRLTFTYTATG